MPAGPKTGAHTLSPLDLSRRDKGLLFCLCIAQPKAPEKTDGKRLRICSDAYSFFWFICTIARPPVSTFRLSALLPAIGMSNPKVRRATVSIFSTLFAASSSGFPRVGKVDAACIFFKGALILGKPEAGAQSTMQLLLTERLRAPVSLIRICPWAWEENSNSYWSGQAGLLPRGQDRPGQLAFYKQESSIT